MNRPRTSAPVIRRLAAPALLLLAAACSSPQRSFADRRAEDHNRAGGDAVRAGDLAAAALHFEQALENARALSDLRQEVDALNNLGTVHELMGGTERAFEYYDAAGELARLGGDPDDPFLAPYPHGVFAASLNRCRLLLALDRDAEAKEALENATAAAAELGTRGARAACQKQRALLLLREGDPALAEQAVREAARLYEISPHEPTYLAGFADARLILGRVLSAQGKEMAAVVEFRAAARLARQISDRTLTAVALEETAGSLERMGMLEDAKVRYRLALEVNRRIPNAPRARRNILALRSIGEVQQRADLIRECDELLAEWDEEAAPDG